MKAFLVTGEVSGDKHGAHLAEALKAIQPDIALYGIGGRMMQEADVNVLTDISHLNAFQYRYLPRIFFRRKLNNTIREYCDFLNKEKPDIVIVIGIADNTTYIAKKIAEHTKAFGIPIFYYFSPHVWLWSNRKTRRVAGRFDRILTIFPQEENAYKSAGANTIYIGHPIIDEIASEGEKGDRDSLKTEFGIGDEKLVVFFPGSRIGELRYHLPIIKNIIHELSLCGTFTYIVSAADDEFEKRIKQYFTTTTDIRIVTGRVYGLISLADVIITSSGTITLEIALLEKPNIIIYRVPWITYIIGRSSIGFKHIGMPNIIMDRVIVPEFLQGAINPGKIARIAFDFLNEKDKVDSIRKGLKELKEHLGGNGATRRAASAIINFINTK
ncbi:MAG: lipid-A-disaccharide synthase [Spirochaetota bacterium]|nr:MAG: lipid-A-disaccharide synthase [Spirochaetota bacterium]